MPQSPQHRPLVRSISLEHFLNTLTNYFITKLKGIISLELLTPWPESASELYRPSS
jgi:hypothetical protein